MYSQLGEYDATVTKRLLFQKFSYVEYSVRNVLSTLKKVTVLGFSLQISLIEANLKPLKFYFVQDHPTIQNGTFFHEKYRLNKTNRGGNVVLYQ